MLTNDEVKSVYFGLFLAFLGSISYGIVANLVKILTNYNIATYSILFLKAVSQTVSFLSWRLYVDRKDVVQTDKKLIFPKQWWVRTRLFCVAFCYSLATIFAFLSYALGQPGKGIAIRAATKCLTNLVATQFFLKERSISQVRMSDWFISLPLSILGIVFMVMSIDSDPVVIVPKFASDIGLNAHTCELVGYRINFQKVTCYQPVNLKIL